MALRKQATSKGTLSAFLDFTGEEALASPIGAFAKGILGGSLIKSSTARKRPTLPSQASPTAVAAVAKTRKAPKQRSAKILASDQSKRQPRKRSGGSRRALLLDSSNKQSNRFG